MNEEVMQILKMIQESKITAEQGAKLLDALKERTKATPDCSIAFRTLASRLGSKSKSPAQ